MLLDAFLVILGLSLLLVGGEALVRGAGGLALLARLTPTVVGLTVVAAGTSMPELVVSVQSAWQGNAGLAVGNVVGSNIFNVAAILGLTALFRPLRIYGNTVRLEWPVMLIAVCQLHLLSRDGVVDRLEGGAFLLGVVAFTSYAVFVARKSVTAVEEAEFTQLNTASFGRTGRAALLFNVGAVVLGAGALAGGSSSLVAGAVGIASGFGVSDTLIGLTIVAAGTSAPELVTSLVAAYRGNADIAVANIIGSSIFNVLAIVGVTAVIAPLPVAAEIVARDNWWMIGTTCVLFPLMFSGMRIVRLEGALLFGLYLTYLGLLIRDATGAA